MNDPVFVKPGMSARDIVKAVRSLPGVCLTSVGMRDAGQSDFKNRHRIHDLKTLAPFYNAMGLFSAETHGGARWHVGIMNRKESPFEEGALLRRLMPNVLQQTLIRETNLFGYRPYPRNVIEHVVSRVDIDVWRCFSFLNDVRNMRPSPRPCRAQRLFRPTISFTSPTGRRTTITSASCATSSPLRRQRRIVLCIRTWPGSAASRGSAA
jgi:pyruvate carboxylase